jgi:long-chain acyl-CoA synthetase
MNTKPTHGIVIPKRRWDFDWMRTLVVLMLVPYHTAEIFVANREWYVKNDQLSTLLYHLVSFVRFFGMPLLFLLAGATACFALRRRSSGQYIKERLQRLLVPLVFGLLVIVPPQVYFGLRYHSEYAGAYLRFYPRFFEVHPEDLGGYSTGGGTTAHLWFILYLLVISLVALPIFLSLKRGAGQRLVDRLASSLARRGMIFLPAVLPIVVTLLIKTELNPLYFLSFYLFGYVMMMDARFEQAIERHRSIALILWPVLYLAWTGLSIGLPSAASWMESLLHVLSGIITWCALLTLLGYGKRFFKFTDGSRASDKFLIYFGEAAYPFYILHQTVLVAIGFYVVQWNAAGPIKYAAIAFLSFVLTTVLYELLVRRSNAARFLLGMKPKRQPQAVVRPSPAVQGTTRRCKVEKRSWFEQYDAGVPHTLRPYPEGTLLDVVSETARQRPHHSALFFKGAGLSYAKLEQLSDAFAAALIAQGVQKGGRVALLMPNCPQFLIAQLGVWKAGAIAALINPLYTESELEHMLQECEAETAVVLSPFYGKLPRAGLHRIIVSNIKTYLPAHLRLLFTLFREKKEGHRVALQPGDLQMSDLLRQHARSLRPDVPVGPDDPALLLFTGGTTGSPKAALGTHGGLLAAATQLHAWFGVELVDWEDSILLLMPMFHVFGNVGIMSTGLVGRNPLVLVPNPRDLNDLLATIKQTRPAFVPGVPTLFNALLKHRDVQSGKIDFRSIKLCISGAAPLLAETKQRFESLTGGRVVEGYALTESMLAAVVTPVHGAYKPGAVGVPLPDVDVRIADPDTGQGRLPPGEVGEILIRAPQLMAGYWQRPTESAETIRDGWLYTGDIGYLDEDGYMFIVDRKKELIKPSGFQVWPREVEEVIAAHPAVHEVGVAGVPDTRQGEAVKAWIVLRPEQRATIGEIRAYCREKLCAYKVPRYIEFRDSLPKSHLGKVLRRELAAEAR